MAKCFRIALTVAVLLLTGVAARAADEVTLDPTDRILILAPHPDDEVIGCGGIIQKAVAMGLPLRVVFLTYGDNNEWSFLVYRKHPVILPSSVRLSGAERHDEAIAAAKVFGVSTNDLTFLGYPDFGTLAIWYTHWGDRPAFRSLLTRVRAVPYATALRPGAPYKGEEILRDLTFVFRHFRPTKIFLSHAADHNQDHRALYLFSRIALWDLEDEIHPQVYPYLIHFAHWPRPRGLHLDGALAPPPGLKDQLPWQTSALTTSEAQTKLTALKQHRSQWLVSGGYLESFVRANELFSDYPVIPLQPAPHAPRERFSVKDAPATPEMPEELTEEERAAFVGMEWKNARIESNALVVTVELSRPLASTVNVALYAFGYRHDKPFAEMPKIHVRIAENDVDGFDQDRHLHTDEIAITRGARQISARIPLATLGNPTRILTSARTYLADVPLDSVSWRVLELPPP